MVGVGEVGAGVMYMSTQWTRMPQAPGRPQHLAWGYGRAWASRQLPMLRTENIFVCWCGIVGSARVAGVGVSLGTLDLVRALTGGHALVGLVT